MILFSHKFDNLKSEAIKRMYIHSKPQLAKVLHMYLSIISEFALVIITSWLRIKRIIDINNEVNPLILRNTLLTIFSVHIKSSDRCVFH